MTTAPSTPHAAAPPAPHDQRVAGMHRSLLALAAYALQKAEQADREARAKFSLLFPLAWLFAGRAFVRDRHFRTLATVLHALAAIVAPLTDQPAPEHPIEQDDALTEPYHGAAPAHPRSAARALALLLAEQPTHPGAARPPLPRISLQRPALAQRQRPPQPRLLPPKHAAPRAAPRPHAA